MEILVEENTSSKPKRIHFIRQVSVSCVNFLQGFCLGSVFGMSSILLPQLEATQEIVLTKSELSWIASVPTLTMMTMVLFAGLILDKFGRKKALIYVFSLQAITWIVTYFSNSFTILLIGRALGGIAIGQGLTMLLTFTGEVTDPSIRGACLAGAPLGVASGIFTVQMLGFYLHWKVACLIVLIGPLYTLCMALFYIRESYIWYINKGWEDKASESFLWYRGQTPKLKAEFLAALDNKGAENFTLRQKMKICLSKKMLYPLGLTCLLYITEQFSGDVAIIFYTSTILKTITNNEDIQYYANLFLNILRIITIGASCILLKKFSLRKLLIGTGYCLSISLFNISLFLYLSQENPENNVYPLVCAISVTLNVVFFGLGLGCVPSVICGELYPAPVRGIGATISLFVCFCSVFSVVRLTPYFFENIAIHIVFLIFGLCTFTGITISCFVLPNTKNRTLKELETFYKK